MDFTVEEMNLICVFDVSSRAKLIREMTDALPHMEEAELIDLTENVIARIRAMDDEEFSKAEFTADDDELDETEV
jgi:predicted DNA-binding protein